LLLVVVEVDGVAMMAVLDEGEPLAGREGEAERRLLSSVPMWSN